MIDWTNCLIDASGLRAIFGDIRPRLSSVELHELSLHRDGPRAVLRFDLPDYPICPPKKWVIQKFNRVQVQLMLIGLHKVRIEGLIQSGVVDLKLEHHGTQVRLTCHSNEVQFDFVASAASINSISAYLLT